MDEAEAIKKQLIVLLPRLRSFARALTRDVNQADDLVQIACEKALRNLDTYVPGTRLDAWLFRIMRNAWIDQYRSNRQFSMAADIDDYEISDPVGNVTEARLELRAVGQAMAALDQDQRELLMLVCVDGMKYRDAAEALSIPLGTVMSRLSRARRTIYQMLHPGDALQQEEQT